MDVFVENNFSRNTTNDDASAGTLNIESLDSSITNADRVMKAFLKLKQNRAPVWICYRLNCLSMHLIYFLRQFASFLIVYLLVTITRSVRLKE